MKIKIKKTKNNSKNNNLKKNKVVKSDKTTTAKMMKNDMVTSTNYCLKSLIVMADAITKHFGINCEVCIHDLKSKYVEHSIVYIANSHVTGRKIGDSFSFNYLKSRKMLEEGKEPTNKFFFHNQTIDGKSLKCSTFFIKDETDTYRYMMCINQDISFYIEAEKMLDSITNHNNAEEDEDKIHVNVNNVLDDIIKNSIKYIGKSPANMNSVEKQKAIEYLNNAGAFLVAKAGDKISKTFGISKFTIYSYINKTKN